MVLEEDASDVLEEDEEVVILEEEDPEVAPEDDEFWLMFRFAFGKHSLIVVMFKGNEGKLL